MNQVVNLKREVEEWKKAYYSMKDHASSLERKLGMEEAINVEYRAWFTRNQHWTDKHNKKTGYETLLSTVEKKSKSS